MAVATGPSTHETRPAMRAANWLSVFPTAVPVSGGALFGRDVEVRGVVDGLTKGQHQVVTGPPRVGKTSVAEAALAELGRSGWDVVRLDLLRAPDLASVFTQLADRGVKAATALGEAMVELDRCAGSTGRPAALLIDEFQELVTTQLYGRPDDITADLRAGLEGAENLRCLFVGSAPPVLRGAFATKGKPLYQLGRVLTLGALPPVGLRVGLRSTFAEVGWEITDEAVDRLVDLGSGHPRVTMVLAGWTCMIAAQRGEGMVDEATVDLAFDAALDAESSDAVREMARVRGLGKHSLATAMRMAQGESPYKGLAPAIARQTLRGLEVAGVVEHPRSGAWRLVDPLFGEFLRRGGVPREPDVGARLALVDGLIDLRTIEPLAVPSDEDAGQIGPDDTQIQSRDLENHQAPSPEAAPLETAAPARETLEPPGAVVAAAQVIEAISAVIAAAAALEPAEIDDLPNEPDELEPDSESTDRRHLVEVLGAAIDDSPPEEERAQTPDADGAGVELHGEPDQGEPDQDEPHQDEPAEFDGVAWDPIWPYDEAGLPENVVVRHRAARESQAVGREMRARLGEDSEFQASGGRCEATVGGSVRNELGVRRFARFVERTVAQNPRWYWEVISDGRTIGGVVMYEPGAMVGPSSPAGMDPMVQFGMSATAGVLAVVGIVLLAVARAWEWGPLAGLLAALLLACIREAWRLARSVAGRARASRRARRTGAHLIEAMWHDHSELSNLLTALAGQLPETAVTAYVHTDEQARSCEAVGFTANAGVISGVLEPAGPLPLIPIDPPPAPPAAPIRPDSQPPRAPATTTDPAPERKPTVSRRRPNKKRKQRQRQRSHRH